MSLWVLCKVDPWLGIHAKMAALERQENHHHSGLFTREFISKTPPPPKDIVAVEINYSQMYQETFKFSVE